MHKVFVIAGVAALVVGAALLAVALIRRHHRALMATVLLAGGALALVTGWLLGEPNPNPGEALKTGGIAAGAVVALYALWLNDRRRQVEERRQALEATRVEHDRERVSDERLARAVELLGNDADQVRVGAMHVLAGLARDRPQHIQTVLDILCSYLRRPFSYEGRRLGQAHVPERQVRGTAQRLIRDLLPTTSTPDAPHYDLDLTSAALRYFDLSDRVVGALTLRKATLAESNSLKRAIFHGDVYLTGATTTGILHAQDATFHARAWFSAFSGKGPVRLRGTRFLGQSKFGDAKFADLDVEPSALPGSP